MAEELEIVAGKSIRSCRKSLGDYSNMVQRSMGEIRSMLVDLCLQRGINEIDGRQLSREDSHIFFCQQEENTNCEGIYFDSRSAFDFNSREKLEYKDHQSYLENLCKNVAIDELKGLGVNEKVDLGQSVIEVYELNVFDEMPRSNLGGDDEPVYDVYDDDIFDDLSGNLGRNEKAGENMLGKSRSAKAEVSSVSNSEKKIPKDNFQETPLCDVPNVSTDFQKSFGTASLPQYFETSERQGEPSDDIWLTVSEVPLLTSNYNIEELQVLYRMFAQGMVKKGACSTHCYRGKKTHVEDDGGWSWLCLTVQMLPQLPLPPPEPPPHQFVLIQAVVKCIGWSKTKGSTQHAIYAIYVIIKQSLEIESWGQDSFQGGSNVMNCNICCWIITFLQVSALL